MFFDIRVGFGRRLKSRMAEKYQHANTAYRRLLPLIFKNLAAMNRAISALDYAAALFYIHGIMFETIKVQLTTLAEKLTHLRRFL